MFPRGFQYKPPASSQFKKASSSRDLEKIEDQVASDFEKQYEIAKKNGGSEIDICVQAQTIAAGSLQAKDQVNYAKRKKIQRADRDEAGVPMGASVVLYWYQPIVPWRSLANLLARLTLLTDSK